MIERQKSRIHNWDLITPKSGPVLAQMPSSAGKKSRQPSSLSDDVDNTVAGSSMDPEYGVITLFANSLTKQPHSILTLLTNQMKRETLVHPYQSADGPPHPMLHRILGEKKQGQTRQDHAGRKRPG